MLKVLGKMDFVFFTGDKCCTRCDDSEGGVIKVLEGEVETATVLDCEFESARVLDCEVESAKLLDCEVESA